MSFISNIGLSFLLYIILFLGLLLVGSIISISFISFGILTFLGLRNSGSPSSITCTLLSFELTNLIAG